MRSAAASSSPPVERASSGAGASTSARSRWSPRCNRRSRSNSTRRRRTVRPIPLGVRPTLRLERGHRAARLWPLDAVGEDARSADRRQRPLHPRDVRAARIRRRARFDRACRRARSIVRKPGSSPRSRKALQRQRIEQRRFDLEPHVHRRSLDASPGRVVASTTRADRTARRGRGSRRTTRRRAGAIPDMELPAIAPPRDRCADDRAPDC